MRATTCLLLAISRLSASRNRVASDIAGYVNKFMDEGDRHYDRFNGISGFLDHTDWSTIESLHGALKRLSDRADAMLKLVRIEEHTVTDNSSGWTLPGWGERS